MNNEPYPAIMFKNSVAIICWTVLAIVFKHWWIALFSCLFVSSVETKGGGDK